MNENCRPEWVKCIQDGKGSSLCGEGHTFSWMFGSLEHAMQNVLNEGRLVPCEECSKIAEEI